MARASEVVALTTSENIGAASAFAICLVPVLMAIVVEKSAKVPVMPRGGPEIVRA